MKYQKGHFEKKHSIERPINYHKTLITVLSGTNHVQAAFQI